MTVERSMRRPSTVRVLWSAAAALVFCCFGPCLCRAGSADPFRLPGSAYPAPSRGANCSVSLLAYSAALPLSNLLLLSSLQGLAARTCPLLFRIGDGSPADMQTAFAADLPAFGARLNASFAADFPALLRAAHHLNIASGYVLCDMQQARSCSAATSYCAASGAGDIVVDVRDEALVLQLLQLPRTFDARNCSVADIIVKWPLQPGAPWSCSVAVLQHPAKLPYLSDLAVFARAVLWYDDDVNLSSPLSQQVLRWLHACDRRAVVIGWGPSEVGTVAALAAQGVAIHAADWAVNLATYASFYAPLLQQQQQEQLPPAPPPTKAKHTVTFLLSDGDNVQVSSLFTSRAAASNVHVRSGWLAAASRRPPTTGGAAARAVLHPRFSLTSSPRISNLLRFSAPGLDHQPRDGGTGAEHSAALLPPGFAQRRLRCGPLGCRLHVPRRHHKRQPIR